MHLPAERANLPDAEKLELTWPRRVQNGEHSSSSE